MAYQSGTAGSVVIVSGGTSIVGGVREWSLDVGQDTPEVTVFGDSWRVYIAGLRGYTGSLTLLHDGANTPQGTVRAAILGGSAPFEFRFAQGASIYSGSAIPNSWAPTIAYDGVAEIAAGLQGSGPLAYA